MRGAAEKENHDMTKEAQITSRDTSQYPEGPRGIALLAFRLTVGTMFLLHSLPKMKAPTSWMSEEGQKAEPAPVQALVAVSELAAGAGLMLGVLTPFAAAGLGAMMLGALVTVHIPKRSPIVARAGKLSAETSIDYLFASLLLVALGPGKYSVDARLFDKSKSSETIADHRRGDVPT